MLIGHLLSPPKVFTLSLHTSLSLFLPSLFQRFVITAERSNKNVFVLTSWEEGGNGHYKGMCVALEI